MGLVEILEHNFIEVAGYKLNLAMLLSALIVLAGAKLLMSFLDRVLLKRFFAKRKVDIGRRFAIHTFIKYILYTLSVLWALHLIGIKLSLLWGGAAALLVGIGLGLQQTFNDLISGIILLSEGTVEVGDIITIDGMIGRVTGIGIRTSKVETRDEISIIIPNSKLVSENVVNLSHNEVPTRFQVLVGVAYSSDVKLVTALLLEAAKSHKDVLKVPEPKVQLKDFGNSSLDFVLHFYCTEYLRIDFIRSEIRYKIVELFRQNKVEIPFPQRDIWVRNADDLTKTARHE